VVLRGGLSPTAVPEASGNSPAGRDVFVEADTVFEEIAAGGAERLERSRLP
jgi:hypothetical protein